MYIKTLELSDFRNYDNLSINFGQDTNILYGDNAQGKTNVLESVYLAATTRSHRGSKDKEIIRFGKEEAHIKMIVMKNEVPVRIDMHLKKNKPKGIAVNGIPLKRASELFGILNVVFFSPEDLNVIKNGPAERRKFIDIIREKRKRVATEKELKAVRKAENSRISEKEDNEKDK